MKTIIVTSIILLFLCCQDQTNDSLVDISVVLEPIESDMVLIDGRFRIYIPKTILDTQFTLLESYDRFSYQYVNTICNLDRLTIERPVMEGNYEISDHENYLNKMMRYYNIIEMDSIVIDSVGRGGEYFRYISFINNDDSLNSIKTFIGHLISEDFKQAYSIKFECSNSPNGQILKDSVYKIFSSIELVTRPIGQ